MTTVADLMARTRTLLQGGLGDELNTLAEPYVAGTNSIKLRYPARNLQVGSTICCGLNTWYVINKSADGQTLDIFPGVDGGPDQDAGYNDLVRTRYRYSNWTIFNEINQAISLLSAPANGVYAFGSFTTPVDYFNGTYPLPITWANQRPTRLLIARYRQFAHDAWQRVAGEWQRDGNEVRVYGRQPAGAEMEFVFAFPFAQATAVTQDVAELGFSEWNHDLPGLVAASRLALGSEARRNDLASQGDPRRPEEVPAGAIIGVSRAWGVDARRRIDEESARLTAMFPYWSPIVGVTS